MVPHPSNPIDYVRDPTFGLRRGPIPMMKDSGEHILLSHWVAQGWVEGTLVSHGSCFAAARAVRAAPTEHGTTALPFNVHPTRAALRIGGFYCRKFTRLQRLPSGRRNALPACWRRLTVEQVGHLSHDWPKCCPDRNRFKSAEICL